MRQGFWDACSEEKALAYVMGKTALSPLMQYFRGAVSWHHFHIQVLGQTLEAEYLRSWLQAATPEQLARLRSWNLVLEVVFTSSANPPFQPAYT